MIPREAIHYKIHRDPLYSAYDAVSDVVESGVQCTWGQKAAYIRRNLPMVERVFKILKLIVISPYDSIKCQSWGGFKKIAFYLFKKAHF